jgi:cell division protein FtsL
MTKFTRFTTKCKNERAHNEKKLKKVRLGHISISMVVVTLTVLVGFVYLVQVNTVSTWGFKIKDLSQRAEDLQRENKKLELQVSELQSLRTIKEASKDLELVGVSTMDYVTLPPSEVALGE